MFNSISLKALLTFASLDIHGSVYTGAVVLEEGSADRASW